MDRQLLKLLDSPIPADRKKAVKAMAQSGDVEYIPYLAALFKTEDDDDIKELTAKAGRYLKKQAITDIQEARATSEEEAIPEPVRVEVSAGNQKRASEMLDRALGLSTAHEDQAAEELVRKAYQIDPNIRLDNYKRGIVSQVLGVSVENVFTLLDTGGNSKEKNKRKNSDLPNDVTWGTAITDLVIYGLVTGATIIVAFIIAIQLGRPLVTAAFESEMENSSSSMYGEYETAFSTTASPIDMVNSLMNVGIGLAIAYGVFVAIFSVISALISCGAIHIAATMMLGGVGTLRGLIHKLVPFYTVVTVVSVIFGFVFGAVTLNDLANTSNDMTIEMSETDFSSDEFDASFYSSYTYQASPIVQILQAVSSLASLGIWIYAIQLIAQAYEFSWLRGCFAQFIGNILLGVAMCGCIWIFSATIANSLMQLSSGM